MAAISWSTAGLFTRLVSTDMATTLFWRALYGGLSVLVIFYWQTGKFNWRETFKFERGEWFIAGISALSMICFISSFYFTSIATVSFTYGIYPFVTYGLALIFLRDKLTPLAIICSSIAAIGVGIMTLDSGGFDNIIGIILAILMVLGMSAFTIILQFYPTINITRTVYISAFMAAIIMAPFANITNIGMVDMFWLGLYGITNIGFGFGVYLMGAKLIPPLLASLIGLIEIPLAPIWAWWLFGETISPQILIAGILILTSVVVYLVKQGAKK